MSGSSFRITTNGMFRNYRSNLTKYSIRLNDTMTKVQTERKFDTYAEDPAAASNAWRLRRSYWRTNDQIGNNNHIISKYESAWAAMGAVVDGDSEHPGLDGLLASIEGVSDTAGAGRAALGRELIATSENIVSVMNSKYGDSFIFSGADGDNVPFSWDGETLLYRGANVSLGEPKSLASFGLTREVLAGYNLTSAALEDYNESVDGDRLDIEGVRMDKPLTKEEFLEDKKLYNKYTGSDEARYLAYQTEYVTDLENRGMAPKTMKLGDAGDTVEQKFANALTVYPMIERFQTYAAEYVSENNLDSYAQGVENYGKLDKMAHETTYVDIGLGMKEDDKGNIISDSAFNSALSGLNFLGYGKDKNLAVAIRELGTIFARADEDTGEYQSPEDEKRADELLNVIHETVRAAQGEHVQLDADAKYLRTNLEQLKTNKSELNEQIMETEGMDAAEAITEMTWAQYCYNAALRIGTQILSQSLIDYLG